jgi:RNA-splicing ligase RtcB
MIVGDLMKLDVSVRGISAGTDIPRSSVHRAMRAIARAEAKKEVAVAEIAKELLGKRLRRGGRG